MARDSHMCRMDLQELLDAVAQYGPVEDAATVNRAHGRERVEFRNGGIVEFRSMKSSLRGYSYSRVYLPRAELTPGVTSWLRPTLAVSGGAIVEYGPARRVDVA